MAHLETTRDGLIAWLEWYAQMGVHDAFGSWRDEPDRPLTRDREPSSHRQLAEAPDTSRTPAAKVASPPERPSRAASQTDRLAESLPAARHAREIAQACADLDSLASATAEFDGCPLKKTAMQCCISDGNPGSRLMLIGEAPGAEEDRQGKPFVGQSGQLLDRMLATISLDRTSCYITNAIFWRPPGNRTPTPAEIATCQPFLERQIVLIQPELLVFVGGIAARALLGMSEGVTKLRGRHFTYQNPNMALPCHAFVMFHPAYLLRQPLQKQFAWRDLLTLRQKLDTLRGGR